jgi:hypothetical protein
VSIHKMRPMDVLGVGRGVVQLVLSTAVSICITLPIIVGLDVGKLKSPGWELAVWAVYMGLSASWFYGV